MSPIGSRVSREVRVAEKQWSLGKEDRNVCAGQRPANEGRVRRQRKEEAEDEDRRQRRCKDGRASKRGQKERRAFMMRDT